MNDEIIYPTSFQAIDILPINAVHMTIYLGRKTGQSKYQFIGGFVDPKDNSLEDAVVRELNEEFPGCKPEFNKFEPYYLFSARIDDERYRNSIHKVMSAVFLIEYSAHHTVPVSGDDIEEVREFKVLDIINNPSILRDVHLDIFDRFVELVKSSDANLPRGYLPIL